ncbi:MAG: DUF3307 domain-containing protein [Pseudomonadota bacterium]
MSITTLIVLLGAHFLADFPLQGSFLAAMKGRRLYILFAHAFIYAAVLGLALFVLGCYADWKVGVLLLSHMLIDGWKANMPADDAHWHLIYYDQLMHLAINVLLILV